MNKNKSLLDSVSKYFTEKTLESIVGKKFGADVNNIEILSWEFENATKIGDNYLSTVERITIKSKISCENKDLKIIVKSLPNNMGRRKTYRSADFFRNEIIFYNEVILFIILILILKPFFTIFMTICMPKVSNFHTIKGNV